MTSVVSLASSPGYGMAIVESMPCLGMSAIARKQTKQTKAQKLYTTVIMYTAVTPTRPTQNQQQTKQNITLQTNGQDLVSLESVCREFWQCGFCIFVEKVREIDFPLPGTKVTLEGFHKNTNITVKAPYI